MLISFLFSFGSVIWHGTHLGKPHMGIPDGTHAEPGMGSPYGTHICMFSGLSHVPWLR